jgi:O-antigen ligase
MFKQRPIVGACMSGFPIRVAPFRPAGHEIELYQHNLWLTTWSELGLLGVIAFAVIFFGLLWRGWRALTRAQDICRPVIWGSAGALLLYLVHGQFDSPFWKTTSAWSSGSSTRRRRSRSVVPRRSRKRLSQSLERDPPDRSTRRARIVYTR